MLCGPSKHCNYKTIGHSYRYTCFLACRHVAGPKACPLPMPNVRPTTPATPVLLLLLLTLWQCHVSSCPSSHYASVWGCQRNYWTMLTTAGAATLGPSDPRTRPSPASPAALSYRFSFRMHNEQFNLENADFIRFLLFIQEMSRSIAHVAAPTPRRHLAERVCNYIHICQRIVPVDLLGLHWWDQLMIVAMINRLKIIYPNPRNRTQEELCQPETVSTVCTANPLKLFGEGVYY